MLTVLSVLAVLAVLFVAATVATREGPILADAPADVADLELPGGQLQPEDLHAVRFGLAVRGYRMSEVDSVLDRAAREIADRDRRILELENPATAPTSVVVAASAAVDSDDEGDSDERDSDGSDAEPILAEPSAAPIVPVEPPLDSPPPGPEPELFEPEPAEPEGAEPESASEELAPGESDSEPELVVADRESEPAEPADTDPAEPADADPAEPADADPAELTTADSDPAGSPTPARVPVPDEASDVADSEVDVEPVDDAEPPPPPPVQVAVVRTEVAPLPTAVSVDLPPTGKDPDRD